MGYKLTDKGSKLTRKYAILSQIFFITVLIMLYFIKDDFEECDGDGIYIFSGVVTFMKFMLVVLVIVFNENIVLRILLMILVVIVIIIEYLAYSCMNYLSGLVVTNSSLFFILGSYLIVVTYAQPIEEDPIFWSLTGIFLVIIFILICYKNRLKILDILQQEEIEGNLEV